MFDMNADLFGGGSAESSSVATMPVWNAKSVEANRAAAAFNLPRADWQREAARRLVHLLRLPKGWDGHQGLPVHSTIAEYVYQLLERLLFRPGVPLPTITPLSYGGLLLEWHRRGWDVEIEVDAPASHTVYTYEISTGLEGNLVLGARLDALRSIIDKIAD